MPPKMSSVSAVLALVATACANTPQYGDPLTVTKCNTHNGDWVLVPPPENADVYRLLASERSVHQSYSISDEEWGRYSDETWLMSKDDHIILCLTDGPPTEAWGSTWWQFAATEGRIQIVDLGGTVTVG